VDAGNDPRQFARQMVDYLRQVLLVRMENEKQVEATEEMKAHIRRHAQVFNPAELLRLTRVFNQAANESRAAWQPALPLELALVEAIEPVKAGGSGPASPARSAGQSSAPEGGGAVRTAKVERSMEGEGTTAPKSEAVSTASQPAGRQAQESEAVKATTPAQAVPETVVASADSRATQMLNEAWQKILGAVRQQNPKAYGLLNSCKSRYLRNDELMLSFASDLLVSQMEKAENRGAVQRALFQVFQREIGIRCTVDTTKRDTVPPGADNDGMVAAAVRDLGGEIVDIQ
jgi:DNA polymerase-3 subunit gamma/tau